ncbi:MAG: carbon storage regulator [Planctomycetaceae bacterium]
MLVLSRRPGERIQIGDNIFVTVVRIGPNTVRIGIEAPREMNVVRGELVVEVDADANVGATKDGRNEQS